VELFIKKDGQNIKGSPALLSFAPFFRDYPSVGKECKIIGASGKGEMQFKYPVGLTVDHNDRIFIADTFNHRIQCMDTQGDFLFKFGKKGDLKYPNDIAFDWKNKRLIVADSDNGKIRVFNLSGKQRDSFGSIGSGVEELDYPNGVAVDHKGNIYVTELQNHRVQAFNEKGNFLWAYGSEGSGLKNLKWPRGIGVFSNRELVVSDYGNSRLCVLDPSGKLVRILADEIISSPLWLCVDSEDNILVVDEYELALFVFSREGKKLRKIHSEMFAALWGVVISKKGEIFLSGRGLDDQFKIYRL